MEQTLTQGGVIVVFAVIVIREVLNFAKNGKLRKNNNGISRIEFDKHKESVQYKDNCTEIVKRMDGRFDKLDENFKEVKNLLRER